MVTTPLERSWRGGQPEASRRCGTENTYVVIDTTKEMDATMFTIQANIYAKHEGQARPPPMVALVANRNGSNASRNGSSANYFTKTEVVFDMPWSTGHKRDSVRLYSLNMPIVDSGVDDITNSMHHLATTTSQEDEIVANAGRIVVVHSA